MKPDAVVSQFTLDVCTQCLTHLTVMADKEVLLFDLKSSSRGPSVSKNTDTYDFIFFRVDEVGWPHCIPAVFMWVQNGEPHLITCRNIQKNCITNMVTIQYSSNTEMCLPVDVTQQENTW